jgi:glycosyltransferase involved in cell wall biosynthesis
VLNDSDLRAALSHRGREFVERHHDWSTVTNQLVDIYQQAITRKRGRGETPASAATLMFSGS